MQIKGMKSLVLMIALFMIVLQGCQKGPYLPKGNDDEALERTERVVLMNKKLAKNMRVDLKTSGFTDDGRLIAYAELRNRLEKNLIVQVQTVFKDKKGRAVGDETNWETVVIPPSSVHYYQAKAMSTQASDYVVRVKLPIVKNYN